MARMTAPAAGVKIRMYRQGHGDCFLLAFAEREGRKKRTVYVLIDCGYKPKSEIKNQKIETIIDDIAEATGGRIDIVVVTHEHQDHVNGFAKKIGGRPVFDKVEVGELWLAWTEDGSDDFANALRERFRDELVALAFAEEKMQALRPGSESQERLYDLIDLESGESGDSADRLRKAFRAARDANPMLGADGLADLAIKGITNKRAIAYLRDRSETPPKFLRPDRDPIELPHVRGVRAYPLGPPRDLELLVDLDPRANEEFHLKGARSALALDGVSRSFFAAFDGPMKGAVDGSPFPNRYVIDEQDVQDISAKDWKAFTKRTTEMHSASNWRFEPFADFAGARRDVGSSPERDNRPGLMRIGVRRPARRGRARAGAPQLVFNTRSSSEWPRPRSIGPASASPPRYFGPFLPSAWSVPDSPS